MYIDASIKTRRTSCIPSSVTKVIQLFELEVLVYDNKLPYHFPSQYFGAQSRIWHKASSRDLPNSPTGSGLRALDQKRLYHNIRCCKLLPVPNLRMTCSSALLSLSFRDSSHRARWPQRIPDHAQFLTARCVTFSMKCAVRPFSICKTKYMRDVVSKVDQNVPRKEYSHPTGWYRYNRPRPLFHKGLESEWRWSLTWGSSQSLCNHNNLERTFRASSTRQDIDIKVK